MPDDITEYLGVKPGVERKVDDITAVANRHKAERSVIDCARLYRHAVKTPLTPVLLNATQHSLFSALEDLDAVEETGEYPPGKWESL